MSLHAVVYSVEQSLKRNFLQRRIELVSFLSAPCCQIVVVGLFGFRAEEQFGELCRVLGGEEAGVVIPQKPPGARNIGSDDWNSGYDGFGYHIGASLMERRNDHEPAAQQFPGGVFPVQFAEPVETRVFLGFMPGFTGKLI